MSNHGVFSGNPKTEWLVDDTGEDRNMMMIEDFSFIDPSGKRWLASKGEVINGASIPRSLWALVGSPYTDDYRRASVVHDVACGTPNIRRKDADVMFFHACRVGGCSFFQSCALYAGVRIGAWIDSNVMIGLLPDKPLLFRNEIETMVSEDQNIQDKLYAISDEMKALPEDASIKEIDAIIDRHLN